MSVSTPVRIMSIIRLLLIPYPRTSFKRTNPLGYLGYQKRGAFSITIIISDTDSARLYISLPHYSEVASILDFQEAGLSLCIHTSGPWFMDGWRFMIIQLWAERSNRGPFSGHHKLAAASSITKVVTGNGGLSWGALKAPNNLPNVWKTN